MNKIFTPLKLRDYLTLTGLIIIGFGWLVIDQIMLPETYQRFIAFIILMFVLFYFQFFINKPPEVYRYANTIALLILAFIIIVSLVLHVIITKDFTYKSILIWIISGGLPYVAGLVYSKTHRK
jgi:hypothetical protein